MQALPRDVLGCIAGFVRSHRRFCTVCRAWLHSAHHRYLVLALYRDEQVPPWPALHSLLASPTLLGARLELADSLSEEAVCAALRDVCGLPVGIPLARVELVRCAVDSVELSEGLASGECTFTFRSL